MILKAYLLIQEVRRIRTE